MLCMILDWFLDRKKQSNKKQGDSYRNVNTDDILGDVTESLLLDFQV